MALLEVDGLARAFGARAAVRGISFRADAGGILAVLGPNGAGKTTVLRMIAGCLEPDAGDARIAGWSVTRNRRRAQARLGYLGEGAPLFGDLTAHEFLAFAGRVHGLAGAGLRAAIAAAAADVRIEDRLGQRVDTLSKGYRRRVALAGAILHQPDVLVLDEPFDGLDPRQKLAMRELLRRRAETCAVLVSTHQIEDASGFAARVLLVDGGEARADASPEALAASAGGRLEEAFLALTAPAAA
jgi:ABC-2 type transport system ATP-binding protein